MGKYKIGKKLEEKLPQEVIFINTHRIDERKKWVTKF